MDHFFQKFFFWSLTSEVACQTQLPTTTTATATTTRVLACLNARGKGVGGKIKKWREKRDGDKMK